MNLGIDFMGNLIVKDNALVEASHKLSEVEQRLILLAILKAREVGNTVEQLKGKELIIHADDYVKTFDINRQMAYKALKKAVMNLYRAEWGYRFINDKGNKVVRYERFTQSAMYIEGEGVVSFRFADAIIPMLVELEKRFTSYEIEQVAQLSSQYAMRLYEFFVQMMDKKTGKGWLDISLDDLRFRFGLLPTEYQRMDNFKRKILDYSVAEINRNTDLSVAYEQHKRGRVITGFTFTFKQKTKLKKRQKQKANAVDMSAPIKMTDSQRLMFANKLAHLSECDQLPGSQQSYEALASFIASDLLKAERAEFYRPLLEKVGYNPSYKQSN